MPMFKEIKDICRICLQEVDYQEVEEINVPKLNNLITNRPFINYSFLQKWQTELFRNHLICSTCKQNFRAVITIYRNSYRATSAISLARNKHQLNKVNLRRLTRFSHIEGDFLVCRLCLKSTRQIAIYLYNNNKNILPVEYISKMLKHLKVYANFDRTINPIMCHECWQNVQISYGFSKRLEVVTEKMFYYQAIIDKIYIDREDLQDVIHMWDKLGIIDIKTEVDIVIKQEVKEENKLELNDVKCVKKLEKPLPIKKNICSGKLEYSFYDDHNYFKMEGNGNTSENNLKESMQPLKRQGEITKHCFEESSFDMPILKPNVEVEESDKVFKFKQTMDTNVNKNGSNRVLRSKMRFIEGQVGKKMSLILDNQGLKSEWEKNNKILKFALEKQKFKKNVQNQIDKKSKVAENKEVLKITSNQKVIAVAQNTQAEELNSNSYRDKLRRIKKYEEVPQVGNTKNKKHVGKFVKKGKTVHTFQKAKTCSLENSEPVKILAMEALKPKRLNNEKEIADIFSQDLLVLRKEKIIKRKRKKRKLNTSFPKHTSTPKISKNVYLPAIENSPSKPISISEYTFETLNLDDEVHVKKEVIEEEELQIKRENLSECGSDENFTENTECTTYDNQDFEEECPYLESFIKSEPPDEFYAVGLDEEGPPELEFQGPCQSVPIPMPCFTIQNTFTVDEKRNFIITADEKRNLLEEKDPLAKPTVYTRSGINATEEKINALPPPLRRSQTEQSNLSRAKNEKTIQEMPFTKIKGDVFKKSVIPKFVGKEVYPNFNQNLIINVTKPDEKATLTFQEKKKPEFVAVSSNTNEANTTQASNSSEQLDLNTRFNIYSTIEKLHIGPEKPYFCQMCDFTSPSKECVKVHISLHSNNSKCFQKVETCTSLSARSVELLEHIDRVHTSIDSSYYCQMCDFSSPSARVSESHRALHANNSIYLHKCKICRFASTRKAGLMEHMDKVHPKEDCDEQIPICDFCNSGISKRYSKILCTDCNKLFHKECFELDKKEYRFKCRHETITYFKQHMALPREVREQYPACNSCKFIIISLAMKMSCSKCNKVFHRQCFKGDQKKLECFNCSHSINLTEVPVIKKDEQAQSPNYCNFCKCNIEDDDNMMRVYCLNCNKIFHYKCFKRDQRELKSHCKHQIWTQGKKDKQSTRSFCNIPTPSKEVKQEMLDESSL